MKKLKELFQQINHLFPCQLTLVNEDDCILATTNNSDHINLPHKGNFHEIFIPQEGTCKLYGTEALQEETVRLLIFMIHQYLKEIVSWDKSQLLARFIEEGQELLMTKQMKHYFQDIQSYHLIWLETLDNDNLPEICQLLIECFIEKTSYTLTLLEEGVLLFLEGYFQHNDLDEISKLMRDTINSELFIEVNIIVSEGLVEIKRLPTYLQELKKGLHIGKVFDEGKHIYFSDSLSLEKMISLIPKELREKIFVEIFQKSRYDEMEEEMHQTGRAFLQNSLNLADTARDLYIHRNTLVYRLDKIHKITGLDLRNLKDALIYKICILIKKSL